MLHSLKPESTNPKVVTTFYGVSGCVKRDGPESLAKCVNTNNKPRYFCKVNTYGVEAGHLVNPWSMYAEMTDVNFVNTVNNRTGRDTQEYREVGEKAFLLYVRYLTSQSDVHYRQAERALIEND